MVMLMVGCANLIRDVGRAGWNVVAPDVEIACQSFRRIAVTEIKGGLMNRDVATRGWNNTLDREESAVK